MKIVVISDTHMPKKAKQLPEKLLNDLQDSDYIIHAGDWQTVELYSELKQFGPVIGVTGNVDGPELKKLLKTKEILVAGDFHIGIVHGHGTGKTTEKRAIETFAADEVDCIVYGHSHIPVLKEIGGVIVFNPGSPTDKRRQQQFSYGILTVEERIIAKHIFF
ncbi:MULTISPECIES: metallophosphoesterase family protein [unclassified Bacillus (in: firmicutes)]|uniref:metallophosphoesterase family protein n=1 Tax=unclassified Bacillus (in: firmicutes) TaxID=185979 RepID=UPI001BE804AE|nr:MULTISPECIES: metallophosphoesterase family protein [unclassified Bacillus (in: firmicutes)]MBT2639498.1 metallophosphoesterase family protein [Bacillus sp. ISL-39]MBT2662504.1 metallophosphoesterase family protein [Bacillus sp. ISL-45]